MRASPRDRASPSVSGVFRCSTLHRRVSRDGVHVLSAPHASLFSDVAHPHARWLVRQIARPSRSDTPWCGVATQVRFWVVRLSSNVISVPPVANPCFTQQTHTRFCGCHHFASAHTVAYTHVRVHENHTFHPSLYHVRIHTALVRVIAAAAPGDAMRRAMVPMLHFLC